MVSSWKVVEVAMNRAVITEQENEQEYIEMLHQYYHKQTTMSYGLCWRSG